MKSWKYIFEKNSKITNEKQTMKIKNEDEWKNFHLKGNNAMKTTQVRIITTHDNNKKIWR